MKATIFTRLSTLFIRNRELGILTIVGMALFGIIGFALMPKQYNPSIVAPAFRIVTTYPQATVDEVYEYITRPMEDKVREIPAVDDIFSQSLPGQSIVTVTFAIGTDKEAAKVNLVQRLRSNMDEKPAGAHDPLIEELDVDDVPVIVFAVTAQTLSESSLRAVAHDIADRLKLVDGTAKVAVYGGTVRELAIIPDAAKMTAHGVDIAMIVRAVRAHNSGVAVGALEGARDDMRVHVRAAVDADTVRALTIRDGVRIDDVARVVVQDVKRTAYSTLRTHDGAVHVAYVAVAKHDGTNVTVVTRRVAAALDALRADLPPGVTVTTVRDDGVVAAREITGLTRNLITSVAIVALVLMVFLSTRSAMIVALAIPLTLLTVFGVALLAGQTINRITLFALILSLGLLVDSATVVVENIVRHMRAKKGYEDNATVIARSVDEVARGLIMSTVTTVLAFIPMAFVTGMMGPYMGPIPFFVPVALVVSLVIALVINPFLAHVFLRTEEGAAARGVIARVQHAAHNGIARVRRAYVRFMRMLFAHRMRRRALIGAVGGLFLIAVILPASGIVPFRMLPKADRDQFYVYVNLPRTASLTQTQKAADAVSDVLLSDAAVASVQSFVGTAPVIDFNGLFKGADLRTARFLATLKVNLRRDRDAMSEVVAARVRDAVTRAAQAYNARSTIVEDPPGPPVRATFHVKIRAHAPDADATMLARITRDVRAMVEGIDGVVDLDTTVPAQGAELVYRVDVTKASAMGVDADAVATALMSVLHGARVGVWHVYDADMPRIAQERFIVVRVPTPSTPAALDAVEVATAQGMVRLRSLLAPVDAAAQAPRFADGRMMTYDVMGEMQDRSVVYAAIDLLRALYAYRLPDGDGTRVSWNLFGMTYRAADGALYDIRISGEWELTLEVFRDMGIAFAVAIVVIYFVLVAQFASLRIPLYILLTIPLALIGVMPGFALLYALNGVYFTATAMIGVIALAGIVVNNAIIYLEYVFQLRREEDLSLDDALIAAGETRLLPIALTSLTTILGSLTIIADPVWEGLAWSIVWGLSLSAFLTLIILPLVYRKFERRKS